jgi:hypothetical protein
MVGFLGPRTSYNAILSRVILYQTPVSHSLTLLEAVVFPSWS